MYVEPLVEWDVSSFMSEIMPALKPVLNIFFWIGAIVMFAEFLIVSRRALTFSFSAQRIVELVVCAFLFVACLDRVASFNFFKNTVAPLVWSLPNNTGTP